MTDDLTTRTVAEALKNAPWRPRNPDRQFDGYNIHFDSTGNWHVDEILRAVAWAGKAYHSTEHWNEDDSGKSHVEWIQLAASEAAAIIADLRRRAEANAALREALRHYRDRCGTCVFEAKCEACQRAEAALAAAPQPEPVQSSTRITILGEDAPQIAPVSHTLSSPAADREAAIEAWQSEALDQPLPERRWFAVSSQQIKDAVALMRSAPDRGDALRELRATMQKARDRNWESFLDTSRTQPETNTFTERVYVLDWLMSEIDKHLASPQPPAPVQPEAQRGEIVNLSVRKDGSMLQAQVVDEPAPAAPRADDGVDEAIALLDTRLERYQLVSERHEALPWFVDGLKDVLRRLAAAARRGGAS